MMMRLGCLVLVVMVCSQPASGRALQNMDGNTLYRFCNDNQSTGLGGAGALLCLGYLQAVSDILSLGTPLAGRKACMPPGADDQQIIDITKNYIRTHPEIRHLPAFGLASQALAQAFPCR